MTPASSITSHPLDAHRRSLRRVAACMVGATLLAGPWALWPLGAPPSSLEPSPLALTDAGPLIADARSKQPAPFNLAAFSAATWNAPPLPPPPPKAVVVAPPPPPPPPLKLQLLGIVRDDTLDASGAPIYIAAIYDEAADRLLMLRAGDRVGSGQGPSLGTITRVTADAVELRDASGPRRLALRQPIAPIPGLSLPSGVRGVRGVGREPARKESP